MIIDKLCENIAKINTVRLLVLMGTFSSICAALVAYIKSTNHPNGYLVILLIGIVYSIPYSLTVSHVVLVFHNETWYTVT